MMATSIHGDLGVPLDNPIPVAKDSADTCTLLAEPERSPSFPVNRE
jgi:hypothetical protein